MLACSIPVLIDGYACRKSDVGKVAISVVERIPSSVIGQEEVEMSIAPEVRPNSGQPKRIGGVANPGLLGHIRECAIAVVVVKT